MKRKTYIIGVAALLAALLAFASVAQAAMWGGVEMGASFYDDTKFTVNGNTVGSNGGRTNMGDPYVIGGVTLGYDFVNTGFGAYNWPAWMKYFSVFTDLTYNRFGFHKGSGGISDLLRCKGRVDGYMVVWSFMLMAHYGFMPDEVAPDGRINPYIAVGPGIMFSGVRKLFNSSDDTVNIALVVEPGIRWICLKNISIDTAARWRYAAPEWEVHNITVKADPINNISFLVRANYHF